jgi:hypothetical protein
MTGPQNGGQGHRGVFVDAWEIEENTISSVPDQTATPATAKKTRLEKQEEVNQAKSKKSCNTEKGACVEAKFRDLLVVHSHSRGSCAEQKPRGC